MAPETTLATAAATLLDTATTAVYRPTGPAYTSTEHGIIVDATFPDSLDNGTLITPLTSTPEGRANVIYRLQILTRKKAPMGDLRAFAYTISELLDHTSGVPNVLGISWCELYSTLFFDPDTQGRVMVAQNFWFRGRRP